MTRNSNKQKPLSFFIIAPRISVRASVQKNSYICTPTKLFNRLTKFALVDPWTKSLGLMGPGSSTSSPGRRGKMSWVLRATGVKMGCICFLKKCSPKNAFLKRRGGEGRYFINRAYMVFLKNISNVHFRT